MVETVAVLADVHCVLPALEAVLAEPDVRAADLVVLAGDLVVGPQPARTVELSASPGDRAVWVSGNCERETVELARGKQTDDPNLAFAAWGARQLRPDQVEWMAGLPKTATLEVRLVDRVTVVNPGSAYLELAEWLDVYLRNPPSDVLALETFGLKDGRAG